MPTENRSSNTEMVSVPRDTIEFAVGFTCHGYKSLTDQKLDQQHAQELLRRILAAPAPQPHPEPLAWMVGTAIWWTIEEAERDAAATGLPIVGLGPMTDTGQVARLLEELGYMREERDDLSHKLERFYSRTHGIKNLAAIEELSDKLAERNALLDEIAKRHWSGVDFDLPADLVARIRDLSANAEPEVTS